MGTQGGKIFFWTIRFLLFFKHFFLVDPDRALKLVRFFFSILSSNCLTFPELLGVLTHLIANGRVLCVAWTPDGTKIASGSDDKVKVWNAQTGQCMWTLSGHFEYVTAVSYSCLFSNVWCVLTIEHFTGMSGVFPSVKTGNKLLVEAGTTPSRYGRRRLARACRR